MSQVHIAPHVCATPAATTTAAAATPAGTAAQASLDSVEDATEKLKIKTHFKHVCGLLAVEEPALLPPLLHSRVHPLAFAALLAAGVALALWLPL